jgi:hypothetical protein
MVVCQCTAVQSCNCNNLDFEFSDFYFYQFNNRVTENRKLNHNNNIITPFLPSLLHGSSRSVPTQTSHRANPGSTRSAFATTSSSQGVQTQSQVAPPPVQEPTQTLRPNWCFAETPGRRGATTPDWWQAGSDGPPE